ncbi:mpv17 / PMP22 family protein [Sarocladium implicatum]|nr:mpv17 / PMP22 family protein [Sarocladium implicatum]
MTWELNRRRFVRTINGKFIYGRIPLLHTLIFFIEMALAARLTARFNSYYDERPLMTMMVTNAILGGIADTVAQTIASVRHRVLQKPGLSKAEEFVMEFEEYDRKSATFDRRDFIPETKSGPPPFDFERLTRFMAYGFCMAPIQFKWFKFLSTAFPMTKTSQFGPALKRVAFDQFIFAPFGVGAFFTVMTIAEGGGRRAVTNKLRDMYIPTLKANFIVWPAVQIVNFRLMPVQFQLPFVSTVGIAWTAYLSLTNASDE